jgi:hypothetical protein
MKEGREGGRAGGSKGALTLSLPRGLLRPTSTRNRAASRWPQQRATMRAVEPLPINTPATVTGSTTQRMPSAPR